MTKEQIEKLNKWETVLNNAVSHNFIHLSTDEFNEIASVYDEIFTPLTKRERGCNLCRLKAVKKVGEEYLKEKNKPKRGRPKKIDLNGTEE